MTPFYYFTGEHGRLDGSRPTSVTESVEEIVTAVRDTVRACPPDNARALNILFLVPAGVANKFADILSYRLDTDADDRWVYFVDQCLINDTVMVSDLSWIRVRVIPEFVGVS